MRTVVVIGPKNVKFKIQSADVVFIFATITWKEMYEYISSSPSAKDLILGSHAYVDKESSRKTTLKLKMAERRKVNQ